MDDLAFMNRLRIRSPHVNDPQVNRFQDQTTVTELLQLSLPLVDSQIFPRFSTAPPPCAETIIKWETLCVSPVPSYKIVSDLLFHNEQQWVSGSRSLTIGDNILPFAILQWWDLVHDALSSRGKWRKALDWLEQQSRQVRGPTSSSRAQGLIEKGRKIVESLQWHDFTILQDVHAKNHKLTGFVSDQWLSDTHTDLLLSVLQNDLEQSANVSVYSPSRTRILRAPSTTKLTHLFRDHPKSFPLEKPVRHLVNIAHELLAGSVDICGGIFHVNENHWVAALINIPSRKILYGDSLSNQAIVVDVVIDSSNRGSFPIVIQVLAWYLEVHSLTGFTVGALAVTKQPDTWSCGILSFGAVAHHLLPAQYPLLRANAVSSSLARIAMLARILSLSARVREPNHAGWVIAATTSLLPLEINTSSQVPHILPVPAVPGSKRSHQDLMAATTDLGETSNGEGHGLLRGSKTVQQDTHLSLASMGNLNRAKAEKKDMRALRKKHKVRGVRLCNNTRLT